MPPLCDQMASGRPDLANHPVVSGKDETVQHQIAGQAGKVDMAGIQGQQIGPATGCVCAPALVQPVQVVQVPRADEVIFVDLTATACPD